MASPNISENYLDDTIQAGGLCPFKLLLTEEPIALYLNGASV